MSTVWITHSVTGGVAEVPETALAMYRQSGWDLLPKRDVAAQEKAAAVEAAAAEKAMQNLAESGPTAAADDTEKENG